MPYAGSDNTQTEAAKLEKLAQNHDSKGLQDELASLSRSQNGNKAYFQALQSALNSSDSSLPKLTLSDNGANANGNENLALQVQQPGSNKVEQITTDGQTTTDKTYTPRDLGSGEMKDGHAAEHAEEHKADPKPIPDKANDTVGAAAGSGSSNGHGGGHGNVQ